MLTIVLSRPARSPRVHDRQHRPTAPVTGYSASHVPSPPSTRLCACRRLADALNSPTTTIEYITARRGFHIVDASTTSNSQFQSTTGRKPAYPVQPTGTQGGTCRDMQMHLLMGPWAALANTTGNGQKHHYAAPKSYSTHPGPAHMPGLPQPLKGAALPRTGPATTTCRRSRRARA